MIPLQPHGARTWHLPRIDVQGLRELTIAAPRRRLRCRPHPRAGGRGARPDGRSARWASARSSTRSTGSRSTSSSRRRPGARCWPSSEGSARITDYFLTDGTLVAAEAVRLNIAPPDRIRALAQPDRPRSRQSAAHRRRRARPARAPRATPRSSGQRRGSRRRSRRSTWSRRSPRSGRRTSTWSGSGTGSCAPRPSASSRKKGLADRFLLLGDRDDVPQLLPGFDVFAMSSLYEGPPVRGGRGDDLRDPGRGDRRQLHAGDRHLRQDRAPRPARRPGLAAAGRSPTCSITRPRRRAWPRPPGGDRRAVSDRASSARSSMEVYETALRLARPRVAKTEVARSDGDPATPRASVLAIDCARALGGAT